MFNKFCLVVLVVCLSTSALGRVEFEGRLSACDGSNKVQTCQEWLSNTKQPDNRMVSCCGEADAFITDNYEVDKDGNLWAIITEDYPVPQVNPGYNKLEFKKGDKIHIPNNKINIPRLDGGNPSGHSITFINPYNGQVYCYFGPTGV